MDQFIPKVRPMLVEKDHGLLITAISLMIEICRIDPEQIKGFKRVNFLLNFFSIFSYFLNE